jgi:hypothetical protein
MDKKAACKPRVVGINRESLTQAERAVIAALCDGKIMLIRAKLGVGAETLKALMSPEGRVSKPTVKRVRGVLGVLEKLAKDAGGTAP